MPGFAGAVYLSTRSDESEDLGVSYIGRSHLASVSALADRRTITIDDSDRFQVRGYLSGHVSGLCDGHGWFGTARDKSRADNFLHTWDAKGHKGEPWYGSSIAETTLEECAASRDASSNGGTRTTPATPAVPSPPEQSAAPVEPTQAAVRATESPDALPRRLRADAGRPSQPSSGITGDRLLVVPSPFSQDFWRGGGKDTQRNVALAMQDFSSPSLPNQARDGFPSSSKANSSTQNHPRYANKAINTSAPTSKTALPLTDKTSIAQGSSSKAISSDCDEDMYTIRSISTPPDISRDNNDEEPSLRTVPSYYALRATESAPADVDSAFLLEADDKFWIHGLANLSLQSPNVAAPLTYGTHGQTIDDHSEVPCDVADLSSPIIYNQLLYSNFNHALFGGHGQFFHDAPDQSFNSAHQQSSVDIPGQQSYGAPTQSSYNIAGQLPNDVPTQSAYFTGQPFYHGPGQSFNAVSDQPSYLNPSTPAFQPQTTNIPHVGWQNYPHAYHQSQPTWYADEDCPFPAQYTTPQGHVHQNTIPPNVDTTSQGHVHQNTIPPNVDTTHQGPQGLPTPRNGTKLDTHTQNMVELKKVVIKALQRKGRFHEAAQEEASLKDFLRTTRAAELVQDQQHGFGVNTSTPPTPPTPDPSAQNSSAQNSSVVTNPWEA